MSTFGDIRSIIQSMDKKAPDKEALRAALAEYDGPWEPIKAYVPEDLMPILWIGGDGESVEVLRACDYRCQKPLSAVVRLAGRDEVIWHSDEPLKAVQRAFLPIRRETVDKHWRPWPQDHRTKDATAKIDAALDITQAWIDGDVELGKLNAARCAAMDAAKDAARDMVRDADWDVAWSAVRAATIEVAWDAIMDIAFNAAKAATVDLYGDEDCFGTTWSAAWDATMADINARTERDILSDINNRNSHRVLYASAENHIPGVA